MVDLKTLALLKGWLSPAGNSNVSIEQDSAVPIDQLKKDVTLTQGSYTDYNLVAQLKAALLSYHGAGYLSSIICERYLDYQPEGTGYTFQGHTGICRHNGRLYDKYISGSLTSTATLTAPNRNSPLLVNGLVGRHNVEVTLIGTPSSVTQTFSNAGQVSVPCRTGLDLSGGEGLKISSVGTNRRVTTGFVADAGVDIMHPTPGTSYQAWNYNGGTSYKVFMYLGDQNEAFALNRVDLSSISSRLVAANSLVTAVSRAYSLRVTYRELQDNKIVKITREGALILDFNEFTQDGLTFRLPTARSVEVTALPIVATETVGTFTPSELSGPTEDSRVVKTLGFAQLEALAPLVKLAKPLIDLSKLKRRRGRYD